MEEVRRLRLEKGWSQNELAYHAHTAPSVISLIETGKRAPNATTLRKLAEAFGVEIPDLFGSPEDLKAPAPQSSAEEGPELRRTRHLEPWTLFLIFLADQTEHELEAGRVTHASGLARQAEISHLIAILSRWIHPLPEELSEREEDDLRALLRASERLQEATDKLLAFLETLESEREIEGHKAELNRRFKLIQGELSA